MIIKKDSRRGGGVMARRQKTRRKKGSKWDSASLVHLILLQNHSAFIATGEMEEQAADGILICCLGQPYYRTTSAVGNIEGKDHLT